MRQALVDPRIARMMRQDRQVAATSLLVLWLLFGFVLFHAVSLVWHSMPAYAILIVFAAALILLLNTASIHAMFRACTDDTDIARIYGPEIQCDQIESCDAQNSGLS